VQGCIEHVFRGSHHHFLGLAPLFHSTGFTGTLLAPIHLGSPVTYLGRFSPVATAKAIRDQKCDIIIGVPAMYGAMLGLKSVTADDFAHTYAVICGGEPLPGNIRAAFEQKFGKTLLQGYGLSETCGPIAVNAPHAQREGSVGQIIPQGKVRIVDEHNQPLAVGQTGEILLGGPTIMHGYLKLPEASAEALTADGFFRTGDLGHVDQDGFLFITGRAKDMIIVSGEKLAPRELEEMLIKLPSVAEAAVVGKKDESRGEVPVAFVVAREGQTVDVNALKEHLKGQNVPNWKLPREIHVVDTLPRSPTGKVLKRDLAARLN
jgi:long-chain acyl-CoA synthetase